MRHHLVRWHEQYADQGLVIIEINGGKFASLEQMRRDVAKRGIGHPVLWDRENQNHQRYGVQVWPSAYLLDSDGTVIWQGDPARIVCRPRKRTMLHCEIEWALYQASDAADDAE